MNDVSQWRELCTARRRIGLLLASLLLIAAAAVLVLVPTAAAQRSATTGGSDRGGAHSATNAPAIDTQFASYGTGSSGLSTAELLTFMVVLTLAGTGLVGLTIGPRKRKSDGRESAGRESSGRRGE